MKELLMDFLENSINYKKLKKSRLKRKLTLVDVAEKTGIPIATLQRYEDGGTKKIPIEAIKKICKVYGTSINYYYAWTDIPLFTGLGGFLISLFYGIPLFSLANVTAIASILGISSVIGLEKLYIKLKNNEKNYKKIIYDSLQESEKEEYNDFKTITMTLLKTNDFFNDIEKEEADNLMFALYMMHQIRKKEKRKKINFEEAEVFSEQ